MENYDVISVAGEGSYGIVMKCRNKFTKKIVAIKKLIDIESDRYAKKMAFREIRILRKLQHENLVKLLEVFRKKKRFYLVFEYLDRTVLDDLEDNPRGLGEKRTKEYMYQLLRGIEYCHLKNVIHRDIKPENLLVSKSGILKLCDFGFARVLNSSNGYCTEYIATRWYRAPELLVRDRNYGRPIDIWAIGCVFAETLSGEPLFPGDSDLDQLFQITKRFGKLCSRHQRLMNTLNKQKEMDESEVVTYEVQTMNNVHALHTLFPSWATLSLSIVAMCLHLDPEKRPTASELLNHEYFNENNFKETFYSSNQAKRKKTRKSAIMIEFDSEHCTSNNSTPRILTNLRKTPSPFENFTYKSNAGNGKSPNIIKSITSEKPSQLTIVNNNFNCSFSSRKILPLDEKHTYAKNNDFPKSPTFSLHNWPEYVPNIKFDDKGIHESQNTINGSGGEIKELPSPELNQTKKSLNSLEKNKLIKMTNPDLNLPYLHNVIKTPKMKRNTYFIET